MKDQTSDLLSPDQCLLQMQFFLATAPVEFVVSAEIRR